MREALRTFGDLGFEARLRRQVLCGGRRRPPAAHTFLNRGWVSIKVLILATPEMFDGPVPGMEFDFEARRRLRVASLCVHVADLARLTL